MNQAFLNEFEKLAKEKNKDVWKSYIAGAGGGVAAGLVVSPLDVINTQMQNAAKHTGPSLSGWQTAKKIRAAKGFKGFYAGLPVKLLKIAPAGAITFGTSMAIKHYLENKK